MKRIFAGLVLLVCLVLFVRFVYVATKTETGWESIALQWREATFGIFAGEYMQVASREPVDQAAYWLRETERIVAAEPGDAELAMGAALLLDAPCEQFVVRHMTVSSWGGQSFPKFDDAAIKRARDEFEKRCRGRCLQMAAKATELQPKDVRWWRLRAIIAFDDPALKKPGKSQAAKAWLALLQECRKHDPDNALYDYLAVSYYWGKGTDGSKLGSPIVDQASFDEGTRWFLRAQQKPFFGVDEGGVELILKLLRRTNLPRAEYEYLCANRSAIIADSAIRPSWRVLQGQAERLEKKGDLADALKIHRQAVHMSDQLVPSGDAAASTSVVVPFFRRGTATLLDEFVAKHPGVVSAAEASQIKTARATTEHDWTIWQDACKRAMASVNAAPSPLVCLIGLLADACAATLSFLLLLGTMSWLVMRWLQRAKESDDAGLGVVRACIGWLAGYAVTFAIFGMAPAGIIAPTILGWLCVAVAGLLVTIVAGSLSWGLFVRRRLQFSIRTLLILTFVWAIILGALKTADLIPFELKMPTVSVPSRTQGGIPACLIEQSMIASYGRWIWAFYQWRCYGGVYTGAGAALGIIAVWQLIRLHCKRRFATMSSRDRWTSCLRCLARSSFAAAVVAIIVYLAVMPNNVTNIDNHVQSKMKFLQSQQAFKDAMTEAIAEIREEERQAATQKP
jgi:hypothetical protein